MNVLLKSAFTKSNLKKVLGLIVFTALFILLQRRYSGVGPEEVQLFIQQFGVFAPLFFLALSFVRPLILFPITVFYLAAGLAFGAFWGGVLALTGALISAWVAHFIASRLGVDFFPMRWRSRICAIQHRVEKQGLRNMVFIRFIPLISYDLISYASGLARLKLTNYMLGTFIGIAPRIFAYTYVGANIIDVDDPRFMTAMIILLLIFTIPYFVMKYNDRKNMSSDAAQSGPEEERECNLQ